MVNMQLLEFNSTDKTVVLRSGFNSGDKLVSFTDVPTVKIMDGYYEVMQKVGESAIPVLRVPIANTNMLIKK
jgi:hypothetical protein